ncbi:MAG: hypothetical protein IT446_12250 [Phycisphaerales bacterium]|nr:hypothetical protein [Phycisphaerales bacterium]
MAAPGGGLSRDLSFYASFDTSAQPTYARGADTTTGMYHAAKGVVGQGTDLQSGAVSYLQPGNLNRDAGTVSFWVKPSVDLKSLVGSGPGTRNIFSVINFKLVAYTNLPNIQPVIYFMTGATLPNKDFQWDYSAAAPIDSLPAGKWTNVTLTYSAKAGRKTVYFNGKRVASVNTKLIEPGDSGDSFVLGEGLPGDYDELAVWGRELTAAEIGLLSRKPAEVASELTAYGKEHVRQKIEWAIYPELIYQNFADSVVAPNEALALKLPLENRTDKEQAGVVTVAVQDVWDQQVGPTQKFDVKLAAKAKQELPFKVSVDRLGSFRVAVTVEVDGKTLERDVTTFGCLPKDPPPSHPFFGGHISQIGTMPQLGRRLGFSRNRVHNMTQFTWWFHMEPQRGQWAMNGNWAYQAYMDMGYTHYGQWIYAPNWAVTLGDGKHPSDEAYNYPPTDIEAMREYVRESLKRFPAIKEWEMWNEPYVSLFWRGSPKDYVELCKVMYTEAKKARPDITVYAQLLYEGPWTREAMKLGVLNYCDAVAYHFYHVPNNDPQSATEPARKLRKLLADNGKPNMPILASEGGMDSTTFMRGLDFADMPPQEFRPAMNYRSSAESLVQAHVVMIADNVGAWYYYFHQPVDPTLENGLWKYVNYSTMEVTNSPKPMAISRAILAWQLDGGKFVSQPKTAADGLRAYAFDRADGSAVAVLWAEDGAVARLHIPADGKVIDLMGNPVQTASVEITQAPAYLHAADLTRLQAMLLDPAIVTSVRGPRQKESSTGGIPAPQKMSPFPIAAELGMGKMDPLDLSGVANSSLADELAGDGKGWMDEGPYNDFRNMTPGKHLWLGAPFVICGKTNQDNNVLTMKGRTFPNGPQVAGPINVGDRGLRGLFFVHTANWTDQGQTVGEYIVQYEDGQEVKLPIVVGQNIDNWWYDHTDTEDSRTVAFKAADPIDLNYPYRFLRVWYWENTRPEAKVKSVSVRSLSNNMTLTVVAITAALH